MEKVEVSDEHFGETNPIEEKRAKSMQTRHDLQCL